MSSNSEKYQRWKRSQAVEQHKKDREEWLESCVRSNLQIQNLKEQVSTLQLQLKTPTKREKELEEELRSTKKEADNGKLLKSIYSRDISVLKEELERCHEGHKKTLMEMKKQLEDLKAEKVCMEADLRGRLEQQCKALKEQEHQHQCQVGLKDRQYHELEQEKKKALEEVIAERDEAKQMIETLQAQEIQTKEATVFDKGIARQNFIHRTEKLREEITELENDAKKAQKKISCLEEAIKDKHKAIANEHKEYAIVAREKSDVRKLLSREQECNALLRIQLGRMTNSNKLLNDKFLQANSECMHALHLLQEAEMKEEKQEKTITTLKNKIEGMGPGLKELQDRVHYLETFQKRFLEDLQTCMPLISDHKELKSRIIALKELYIDKKHLNLMNDTTERGYKHKIANLRRRLSHSVRTVQDQSRTVKHTKLKHEETVRGFCKDKNFYIDALNAKIKEVAQLKEEHKETKVQPQCQRSSYRLKNKVVPVSPDVAAVPDNSQSPSLPEDDILSSPSPSPSSSSSKPHPCLDDDTVILVRPYAADCIPQAEV